MRSISPMQRGDSNLESALVATPLLAQTVTRKLNGWMLYHGAGPGKDPAVITGAQRPPPHLLIR